MAKKKAREWWVVTHGQDQGKLCDQRPWTCDPGAKVPRGRCKAAECDDPTPITSVHVREVLPRRKRGKR